MPSYPALGIRLSYQGFYIINLPSHLDHWQLMLYLRQGYKRLSLTFYLSLTLQWGWCLTTQAETLFITWFISVYGGGGEAHCHMCTVRAPCYNCGPGPLGDVVRHTGRWSPGLHTAYTPATGTLQLLLILTPAVLSSQIQGSNNN